MGLDVTAYERVVFLGDDEGDDEGLRLTAEPGFGEHCDGLANGLYRAEGDRFSFRAGSYSGYNGWRNQLAVLVGWASAEAAWSAPTPGPFYELIHNSDCEGFIGPKTAAKLAGDFEAWHARAAAARDAWFMEGFNNWLHAFRIAAGGGVVKLH